jgi:DNA-binding response OmpR family regulator
VRHELKTPITIVRGHLELMDPTDPADAAATRELGIAELDRMTRLIGDIDLLAAVESDSFTMGDVDIATLTGASRARRRHPRPHVEVEQSAAASSTATEIASCRRGCNWPTTRRSTPRGQRDRDRQRRAPSGAQLWVRDHGPGIPPAMRHRIFRRFDRGAGKRSVGGSGLGLAIVDTIAKAHGGRCTVADTPGGGATFTIEIPIGTSASFPHRCVPAMSCPTRGLRMTRILVVDDEPHIVALVTRALRAEGYDTVSPTTARPRSSAPRRATSTSSSSTSASLAGRIRGSAGAARAGGRMPVIMLTARSSARDAVDGLDAGASDYVPKPFSVAELLARVRSRLRERTGAITMVLSHGDVTLDLLARRATVAGREVDLSAREFALAEQFLRHPGEVLTRERCSAASGAWTSTRGRTSWTSTCATCAASSAPTTS